CPASTAIYALSLHDALPILALIGPVTNLVMGFGFLFLSFVYHHSYGPYFDIGASFNGWIAMFNLIPMGVLDGQKIFDWNKLVWGDRKSTRLNSSHVKISYAV